MKSAFCLIKYFFISLSLILSTSLIPSLSIAQTDTSLDDQRNECSKNTAAYWDSALNRCVGTKEARQERHEAQDCNKIPDINQRAECHKKLAEQKTGLNSDPNSLNSTGGTNKSMVMNMINDAYMILGFVNNFGSKKTKSDCMSKKIFGVTALAGTLSDFYLKARARSKVKELTDKYKLDVKDGAHDSQIKAFEYLKDEQNTVADIANMEKKRNMLLMLGYGAATAMAIYELTPMGMNAACTKPEKEEDKKCPDGQEGTPPNCKPKDPEKCAEGETGTPPNCQKPEEKKCAEGETGTPPNCQKPEEKKCADGESGTPPNCSKPASVVVCSDGSKVQDSASCPQPKPTPVETDCTKNPDQANCKPPAPDKPQPATINSSERMVNGKQIAYYKTTIDGKTYDIVDNQLYPAGSRTPVGQLNYSNGQITIGGTVKAQITQVTGANTAWIPNGNLVQIHNKMSPRLRSGI